MTEADGDWFITATRIGDGYNRYCGNQESYRDVLAVGGSKLILPPRKSSPRIIPAWWILLVCPSNARLGHQWCVFDSSVGSSSSQTLWILGMMQAGSQNQWQSWFLWYAMIRHDMLWLMLIKDHKARFLTIHIFMVYKVYTTHIYGKIGGW